jgi:rhamnopyranosyl-N-acetylglucosaminyl-diphospho-decaprenol beta-1,3/1,4-galactofuranosyltransferase
MDLIKKEMFIWGDETEYSERAKKAGYKLYTITKAIHYHPPVKGKIGNVIPFIKKWGVTIKPSDKAHIFYRNKGYLAVNYWPHKVRKEIILYSLYYFLRFNIRGLLSFLISYRRGMKSDFC